MLIIYFRNIREEEQEKKSTEEKRRVKKTKGYSSLSLLVPSSP
jgi:hypothetical protein